MIYFRTSNITKINKSISALTKVDSDIQWLDTIYIIDKSSDNNSHIFEYKWLCHYPRPAGVVHDNIAEFTGW